MRFYRGITVPSEDAERVMESIWLNGLAPGQGTWSMTHEHPGNLKFLHLKQDLSLDDTRPGTRSVAAICACGDETGAAYYACSHNKSEKNDKPILIEFTTDLSRAAIDGKDFLYTAFQLGDPSRARPALEQCFGTAVLAYADRAWTSEDQSFRVAQCDLAIHDPEVIEAHHANKLVIAGRCNTHFRSAFTISLPVRPAEIVNVSFPSSSFVMPQPNVRLTEILRTPR